MDQNAIFWLDLIEDAAELVVLGAILWSMERKFHNASSSEAHQYQGHAQEIRAALDQSLLGR